MITLHNTLDFPEGTELHRLTEVRFHPDPANPAAYVQLYMPTTRDQGWIQVTASPFRSALLSQHNSGLFLRSAAWSEIRPQP